MTETQKIIKYIAIAFAFFIIFSIFSGIMMGLSFFSKTSQKENSILKIEQLEKEYEELKIELHSTTLTIKEGKFFQIETNNNRVNIQKDANNLTIREKGIFISSKQPYYLIITIPKDYMFNQVSINNGAGTIDIKSLITKELKLNLEAGKTVIENLEVTNKTKIEGGTGLLSIQNGSLSNLDLELGVGKVELTSKLLGNNKIEAGIGEVNLNLIGKEDDYQLKITKGIGNITIKQEKVKNDSTYGSGNHLVDVEGGIGNIQINITEK